MPSQTKKRTRKTHAKKLSDELLKHSPIKKGLVVKDEDKPYENYNKIMSKVYLGNYHAAKDANFFKKHNIKAVLNCTKDIPNYFADTGIEYMRIPVDDSLKEVDFKKMYEYAPCISEFLHKHATLQRDNIFIHCYAGRQRSVCAIVFYLIDKHNLTPSEACKKILGKRKEAFHFGLSLNFEDSINKFYKDIQAGKR